MKISKMLGLVVGLCLLAGCGYLGSDSGGGGGSSGSGGGSSQYCDTGYCYSYLEQVCCPRSAPYACGGSCYTYSGGGRCSSYKTQCY
jgi:hypothetical protein